MVFVLDLRTFIAVHQVQELLKLKEVQRKEAFIFLAIYCLIIQIYRY